MIRKIALFVVALSMPLNCIARSMLFKDDVQFHASFDGTLNADIGTYQKPVESTNIEYTNGRFGKGIIIGEGAKRYVAYKTDKNLNPNEGTCIFWVNCMDWTPGHGVPPHLMFFSGNHTAMVAFGQEIWSITFLVCDKRGIGFRAETVIPARDFERAWTKCGDWNQIGFSWKKGVISVFWNGKLVVSSKAEILSPYAFGDKFILGNPSNFKGASYLLPGDGKTAIDDITIYSRALNEAEVRLLYNTADNSTDVQNNLLLIANEYVTLQKISTVIITRAIHESGKIVKVILSICDISGKTIKSITCPQIENGQTETLIPTNEILSGDYILKAQAMDGMGKILAKTEQKLTIHPIPEWANNSIGKEDIVPWPFTPLQTKGDDVLCWGRQYSYDKSLLPSQIVTQRTNLLRAPMEILLSQNGSWQELHVSESRIVENRPTYVDIIRKSELSDISITCKQEFDYDGSGWITLTLTPKEKSVNIDGLKMLIPFKAETATYMHSLTYESGGKVKDIMEGKPVKTFPFNHAWWVGNPDVGLQWFASSDRNWISSNSDTPKLSAIVPRLGTKNDSSSLPVRLEVVGSLNQPDGINLEFNLIDIPVKINGPVEYKFGLQALPYKPAGGNIFFWRHCYPHLISPGDPNGTPTNRNTLTDKYTFSMLSCSMDKASTRNEVVPPRIDNQNEMAIIHQWQQLAKKIGVPMVLYFSMKIANFDQPQTRLYIPEWDTQNASRLCIGSSWADYLLWQLNACIDKGSFEGVYIDNSLFFECFNPLHNECNWVEANGERHGELNLRAEHEFRKRLYVMLYKKAGKRLIIEENASGYRLAPLNSFSTCLLDGESIASYIDSAGNINPRAWDMMKTIHSPTLWSAPVYWFGHGIYYRNNQLYWCFGPDKRPFEAFAGFLMLNGISIDYASGQHYKAIWRLFDALDKFDMRQNVIFIPYYKAGDYISVNDSDVKISIYVNPQKNMLFVFNPSDKDKEVTVKLDIKKLGIRELGKTLWAAEDNYNDESYFFDGDGILKFPIKAKSIRPFIIVK